MAQHTSISAVRVVIMVLVFGFFAYILGPPLYWHFVGDTSRSCAPCPTECPQDAGTKAALAVCPKVDAELEVEKRRYQKLEDETRSLKQVAEEAQAKLEGALQEAKKTASQNQKQFEQCNSGMKTSEGAREEAEKLLAAEMEKAALWEARAIKLGWKLDDNTKGNDNKERRETEETTKKPEETTKKPEKPLSKNGPKIMAELQQNLAIANYLYDRAVKNEMGGVKLARQRALDLNLL